MALNLNVTKDMKVINTRNRDNFKLVKPKKSYEKPH